MFVKFDIKSIVLVELIVHLWRQTL